VNSEARDDLSGKNLEIVQHMYEACARRDIEAILALLSADVEWWEPPNPFNPAAGTRHGHDGFLECARYFTLFG